MFAQVRPNRIKQEMNPRYLLLYLPFILAYLTQSSSPSFAYWIAWGGSFWIYFITFTGVVKKLPTDRPLLNQVFRPFFLVHLVFSGYMSVTSVFFFLDSIGYLYFDKIKPEESYIYISNIAYCQLLYCLAHAAYVHGLLIFLNYKTSKYAIKVSPKTSISRILFLSTLFFLLGSIVFKFLPGGAQFLNQFTICTSIFAIFSFGYALLEGKKNYIFVAGLMFAYGEVQALTSGWKELTILPILFLGAILWTQYKKIILFISPLIIFLFLFVVPYYTGIVQGLSWSGNTDTTEAAFIALNEVQKEGVNGLLQSNWLFLTNRLSEISMFMLYTEKVPTQIPYMTKEILWQSIESIYPRIFYPEKPVTEKLVMERVYMLGVIDRRSSVSAKPAFVVDAFLIGGEIGVFCSLFVLGFISTLLSKKAESLFGGYIIGSGCIFLGLFLILLRGNSFEFLANAVFWSTVTMYILFYVARRFGILVKNPNI